MSAILTNNILSSLTGTVVGEPTKIDFDDTTHFSFTVATKRKSLYEDLVEIVTDDLNAIPKVGSRVRIVGFIFAYYQDGHIKLCVYSLGIIEVRCALDKNLILCVGAITKKPNVRTTPGGIFICDVMLAVNNEIGKTVSSYIPCVSWNSVANDMSKLNPGDKILIVGRLQSREYIKQTPSGAEVRIAKELSINSFNLLKENYDE